MGICPSKYHAPYKYFPTLINFRKTFECLQVTEKEVGQLYKHFKRIDVDDSGDVELAEVLVHLHVEKTFFNKRVFGLLDVDASGELNFEEFMVGLWNYCSVEDEFFEHFAFDLYDTDNSGNIDIHEAQFMIKDIYGEEFEHNVFAKRAHMKLAELDMEKINFTTFVEFCHKHKAMLYPAFALQLNLKKYIMGQNFWHRQAINRLILSGGKYRTITDIIGKEDFHRKRKLHKRKSDLINMFRQASSDKDVFSVPGSAFLAGGSKSFAEEDPIIPHKRRGSKVKHYDEALGIHSARRGSRGLSIEIHENAGGQQEKQEKAGARRGSKNVAADVEKLNNQEKGRRVSLDKSNHSDHKHDHNRRRGSKEDKHHHHHHNENVPRHQDKYRVNKHEAAVHPRDTS